MLDFGGEEGGFFDRSLLHWEGIAKFMEVAQTSVSVEIGSEQQLCHPLRWVGVGVKAGGGQQEFLSLSAAIVSQQPTRPPELFW